MADEVLTWHIKKINVAWNKFTIERRGKINTFLKYFRVVIATF